MKKPSKLPGQREIDMAIDSMGRWRMHFYQLLYFQDPRLTQPGPNGYPFSVAFSPDTLGVLTVNFYNAPEYAFKIHNTSKSQEDQDLEVLNKCSAIMIAHTEKRQKFHSRACCPLAEQKGCVCTLAYDCILHGTNHIGSHD